MSWYDFLIDTGQSVANNLKSLANPLIAAGEDATQRLKKTASDWYKDYQYLQSIPDAELSPELLAEKRRLLNTGQSIINKIKTMGLAADQFNNQMGFVPVIAAAVVASAAGMMYYWYLDYQKFKTRLAEYKSLRASGMSDRQAKETIKVVDAQNGMFSNLQGAAKYGAIGGGLFLGYLLLSRKK
jgi:hypothetical protein